MPRIADDETLEEMQKRTDTAGKALKVMIHDPNSQTIARSVLGLFGMIRITMELTFRAVQLMEKKQDDNAA